MLVRLVSGVVVQELTTTAIVPKKGNTNAADLKYDLVKIRSEKDKLNAVIGNKDNSLPKVLLLDNMDNYKIRVVLVAIGSLDFHD
jgi:hypothetical protein